MRSLRDFVIARLRDLMVCSLVVLTIACGTTAEVAEAPAPQPQKPAPDPRISEMQVLLAELLDRIEVLNARLQRIESAAPSPTPTEPGSTTPPAPVPRSSSSAPAQPAARSARTPSSAPLTGAAIAQNYRDGLALFGKGALDESRKRFQEVLESDPNGELADNALYWMGETYFVTGKYSEAMNLYQQILKDYSDENKAPDAMLKMGLAYVKLGDLSLARSTFQQLIQKYPYSTPASAAKQEINRIKY